MLTAAAALCSKIPFYHSTENTILVENDDIRIGEAYAPSALPGISEVLAPPVSFFYT